MLLNENRAIVTEIPGTTRDIIEESIVIGGVAFRIFDTAGLRESLDVIENEGIRRAESSVATSDIVVFVIDSTTGATREDLDVLSRIRQKVTEGHILLAINKSDLKRSDQPPKEDTGIEGMKPLPISAKTGAGFDRLKDTLLAAALGGARQGEEGSVVITRSRHRDSLGKASEALSRALAGLSTGASNEFLAVDVRAAIDALGEIVGVVVADDVLNHIFSSFCIGK
jgi:tRNA modification GTPase